MPVRLSAARVLAVLGLAASLTACAGNPEGLAEFPREPVGGGVQVGQPHVRGGTPGSPTPLDGTLIPAGMMWVRTSIAPSPMRSTL